MYKLIQKSFVEKYFTQKERLRLYKNGFAIGCFKKTFPFSATDILQIFEKISIMVFV